MGFSRQDYWSGLPLPSPTGDAKSLEINLSRYTGHLALYGRTQPDKGPLTLAYKFNSTLVKMLGGPFFQELNKLIQKNKENKYPW